MTYASFEVCESPSCALIAKMVFREISEMGAHNRSISWAPVAKVKLGWADIQCQCEKNLSHEGVAHFGIKRFLAAFVDGVAEP